MPHSTILVVQDKSGVNTAITDQLKTMGYRVCSSVENGEEAIAQLSEYCPDLVLMSHAAFCDVVQSAYVDALTGLMSRRRMLIEIEREILFARRRQQKLAVVLIDLDHFKHINDSYGHDVGDVLLQVIAEALSASVRPEDCVGRLGDDEFVVLLPDIQGAEVLSVTKKIEERFLHPIHVSNQEMVVGLSMGVSVFPDDGDDPKALLRCADEALHHAKTEGRNHLQFYRPELTARIEERLKLEVLLRRAIERQEFELFYQPIVLFPRAAPLGAEALIRWHHPEQGMMLPDSFISLAEETGLIVSIGEWVLRKACTEAMQWPTVAGIEQTVYVNISPRQFKTGDLTTMVMAILKETHLPPSRLCLEINEQTLLHNTEQNLKIIADLKAYGVRFSIDDFGIGYSSLSYLKRFTPNELKIDRSFVHDISSDSDNAAIVHAVIALAHSLKLQVVAEGVEFAEDHIFLEETGCEAGQGFFYAKPLPAHDFKEWLNEGMMVYAVGVS